jgi:pimeloyl-ACP methyl ester carboxylesterase
MAKAMGLEQRTVTLPEGARIVFRTGGPEGGRPVVLLHGGGTDNGMLSWRDTIPALVGAGLRVYVPDMPGYGDSPPDVRPSTMKNLIGYLGGLMDAWQLDRAALVGVSMGGAIAIGYTLWQPARVERLVLIGTYGIQDRAPFHRLSYLYLRVPWLTRLSWALMRRSRALARYSLAQIVRNPRSRTEALVDEVLEALQDPNAQRAFGTFQRDEIRWHGVKTNYVPRLSAIDVPVLLIHGSHDIGVTVRDAERAMAHLRNGRLEVIEGAGHWTQRDDPERVNRLLLDWLAPYAARVARQVGLRTCEEQP